MANPETIPVAELLAPIPGDSPAGTSLRKDTTPGSFYYKIKDARAAARAAERAAMQLGDISAAGEADWETVLELAPRILRERAKDLEIVAWYVEALVRRHGFAGLRDGFKLARGLVDAYWDALHPMPDEDGLATRLAPLTGLNGDESEGTLIIPIGLVPLTERTEHGEYSTWHYQQSGELGRLTDQAQRAQRVAAGAVPMERIVAAIAASKPEFLRSLSQDLNQCRAEFALLNQALDTRAGAAAPPASSIQGALDRANDALNFLAKDLLLMVPEVKVDAVEGSEPGPAEKSKFGGTLQSREDALRALTQIAEYFRRTEPHSPVPYGIERVVRWAGLPLPALIGELILDDGARGEFHKLTGTQPPAS